MSVIPGEVETDRQPPMAVPLRHFVVGFGFLLLGGVAGVVGTLRPLPGFATLAHVHLLLAGWVCVTIMGAMTQFVPVWSGVEVHSRRLAVVQLWLVTAGVLGFAATLLWGPPSWLTVFGGLMVAGFWTFVYNVGRTLHTVDSLDVTERHFALALGYFVALTVLGFLLAVDFAHPLFGRFGISRTAVVTAHATLAVFGAVLTTVLGALYQLGTMFTQTTLHGVDEHLKRVETVGYPVGVVALALGRLLSVAAVARVGGLLVVVGLLAFGVVLTRRLYETRVEWTPMLSRYAVVAPAMVVWAVLAASAWVADPLARTTLLGAPGTVHLLVLGVVGFVVLGTLYHVVPFIVWVHRYSDLLGYEPVPMIDDLYSARVAAADFVAVVVGTGLLVLADWFALPPAASVVGGLSATAGFGLFVANMLLVVHDHGPYGLRGVLTSTPGPSERNRPPEPREPPSEGK